MGDHRGIRPALLGIGVVILVGVVAFLAWPRSAPPREVYHHSPPVAAALHLRTTVAHAQSFFREGDKEGDGSWDYGTLTELIDHGLLTTELQTGTHRGYVFRCEPGSGAPLFVWWATASPTPEARKNGYERTLFTNHAGVVYYTTSGAAATITSMAAVPSGWLPMGK